LILDNLQESSYRQMKLNASVVMFLSGGLVGLMQSWAGLVLFSFVPMLLVFRALANARGLWRCMALVGCWAWGYLGGALFWLALGIYRPPVNGWVDTALVVGAVISAHAGLHALAYGLVYGLMGAAACAAPRAAGLAGLGLKRPRDAVDAGATIRSLGASHWALILSWPLAESVRSIGFWAMPWGFLGYGQIDNPLFKGLYPLIGSLGVSAALWGLAGVLWCFGSSIIGGLALGFGGSGLKANRAAPTLSLKLGAALLAMLAWASQWIDWTQPSGPPLQVQIVHTDWPGESKYAADAQALALTQLLSTAQAAGGAELTVFPELFLVIPPSQVPAAWRQAVLAAAQQNQSALLMGSVGLAQTRAAHSTPQQQNTAVLVNEKGQAQTYAKAVLLPFSEYLPQSAWLSWAYPHLYRYPLAHLQPGPEEPTLLHTRGVALGITLCSELAYATRASQQAAQAGVLVNPSNDAWIASAAYMRQALQIARARAAEAQKPLLRPNNVGYSAFIDHQGQVLSALIGEPGTGFWPVQPRAGVTPYVALMNWLAQGLSKAP
jgi:apolipoprotein N-acyltransferase